MRTLLAEHGGDELASLEPDVDRPLADRARRAARAARPAGRSVLSVLATRACSARASSSRCCSACAASRPSRCSRRSSSPAQSGLIVPTGPTATASRTRCCARSCTTTCPAASASRRTGARPSSCPSSVQRAPSQRDRPPLLPLAAGRRLRAGRLGRARRGRGRRAACRPSRTRSRSTNGRSRRRPSTPGAAARARRAPVRAAAARAPRGPRRGRAPHALARGRDRAPARLQRPAAARGARAAADPRDGRVPDPLVRSALEEVLRIAPEAPIPHRDQRAAQLACVPPYCARHASAAPSSARRRSGSRASSVSRWRCSRRCARALHSLSGPDHIDDVIAVADEMLGAERARPMDERRGAHRALRRVSSIAATWRPPTPRCGRSTRGAGVRAARGDLVHDRIRKQRRLARRRVRRGRGRQQRPGRPRRSGWDWATGGPSPNSQRSVIALAQSRSSKRPGHGT